jgi:ankyrin repeat protein
MSRAGAGGPPAKQAGWLYSFFFPNKAARYNEDQRKLKRKEDDLKLHKTFKLLFDIQDHDFEDACRTLINDRSRAKIKNVDDFLPLHLALYERAPLQLIELLIDAYPQALKERDPKGLLPIMIGARDPTVLLTVIRTLTKCHVKGIQEKDPQGDLPVHLTIRHHLPKESSLELLDHYPESLNVPDQQGNNLLHMALRFSAHDELVEELVRRNPSALLQKNKLGDLPLHRACLFHASYAILSLLVSKYPQTLFERDAQGNLPIHLYYMQCKGGRPTEAMMHFFLEPYPGSIGVKNAAGCTPIQVLDKYFEQLECYKY